MSEPQTDSIALPGFVVDLVRAEVRDTAGRRVNLRPQVYALLRHLALESPRLVAKDELMQAVWPGVIVTDDSLTQCIKDLLQALGDRAHRLIQTESRRGYRLCQDAAQDGLVLQRPDRAVAIVVGGASRTYGRRP